MEIFYIILGRLLNFCFGLISIYPAALILFTLLTKVILLPVNIWVQHNSIKLVKLTPELNEIKYQYCGDADIINEHIAELYKKEKYHPFGSVIPMIFQLVLLMGVIEVVKNPEYSLINVQSMVYGSLDYSVVPSEVGGVYLIFPILAALSALLMCHLQNKAQVLQAEQGNLNKYGMMIFSALLSLYLGFFVKAGIAVYWIFSNLFSILQMYLLNVMIDPKKHIDYERLEESKKKLEQLNNSGKKLSSEEKKRERRDYKRFFSVANKHLVFYSEQNGFYKYYKKLIEWLLSHSNVTIHYITSDPNDSIIEKAEKNERIRAYFIGEKRLISLFLKMDADIVVMTVPDLDNFHIKRSYVRDDVEYIYMDHGMTSVNMLYRKGALDHYDTIFCSGQHMCDEIRAQEAVYGLPEKRLIEFGYGLIEDLIDSYGSLSAEQKEQVGKKQVLIAPSYQKDNILDSCLDSVVEALLQLDCTVIIRPHPQYIRRFEQRWKKIEADYGSRENVILEQDFSSNSTIYSSDLVVTDWSNIGYEYSFSTLKPALYINTPMKVINEDYKDIDIIPVDIALRDKAGISVEGSTEAVKKAAERLLFDNELSAEQIASVRAETVFNLMESSKAGGKYILSRLMENQKKNKA